jgi:iron(III) transport system ATP-binding protein
MIAAHGKPVIQLEGLSVARGNTLAVDNASLIIRGREITALVGPSGCGKTSVLRTIAGFELPVSGSVLIAGEPVAGVGRWVSPERRRVGMVFQEGAVFPHLNVWNNVLYGVTRHRDGEREAERALRLVGLDALRNRFPDELSGGQQQLVALARALAPAPRVVLLDEPFASLDASLRQRLREEVRSILRTAGITAVLVTHDQEEALSLADRVAVMRRGRILQVGSPGEVYDRPSSVEVAEFIGGGQLIDCTIARGRLESAVGALRTDAPDGAARLLVRPEAICILPAEAPAGVPARVVHSRYFGHDALHEVELAGGERLQVRTWGSSDLEPGPELRVALTATELRVFADAARTAHTARVVDESPRPRSGRET